MKNRFKVKTIIAMLSAVITAIASVSSVSGYDIENLPDRNEWNMTINRTEVDAISLNLRDIYDSETHSIESRLITLDCEISSDSDGYIYVDFSTQQPELIEDIEIPVSFFDRIANATSEPCYVVTPNEYMFASVGRTGEIVDDEGYSEGWLQIIRKDKVPYEHTVDGQIASMRFAYSPMNVWEGNPEIPVMTHYKLIEHPAEGKNGNYFEMYEAWEMYADMPEINISYLMEMERQINEFNSQIDKLQDEVKRLREMKTAELPNPDFNGDGRVSIADAVCLMKYISGIDSV